MVSLVTDISRYLIIIIIALYTGLNFYVLRKHDLQWQDRLCRKQIFLVFLFHFLSFLIIFMRTEDPWMLVYYLIQASFFMAYRLIYPAIYPSCSKVILSNTMMLLAISLVMLTRLDMGKSRRQFVYAMAAAVITLVIPLVIEKIHLLSRLAWLYAIVGIGLLGLVWRMGNTTYGAQLSFSFGGITLQPSEFVKLSFVFFTASMFRQKQSFARAFATTVIAAAHVLILVASTDLGSGLVYFLSYIFMIYVATRNWQYLAAGSGMGVAASVLAYQIFDHVKVRVAIWKDPFADYNNKGYQLCQALFAIGSGGWFGLGLYRGVPNKIPVVTKDSIFAAICEEMGMIFGICIILIYLGFIIQMFWISTWMDSLFYKIVGFGLAVMVGAQTILHIGGITAMIPMTGITLPLISYGGSSLIGTMIIIGIIQGLHLMKQKEVDYIGRRAEELYEETPPVRGGGSGGRR
jgi:cell division protein FtsW (lipid II flippase)